MLGISRLWRACALLNRYDVENITPELFDYSREDGVLRAAAGRGLPTRLPGARHRVFAVEYLPGQFDQRADSAAQCIQIISQGERPLVRTARVYLLNGKLTDEEVGAIKKYVINPVEAREASLDTPRHPGHDRYDIPGDRRHPERLHAPWTRPGWRS